MIFSAIEIVSMLHGFLGLMIIIGLSFSLAELFQNQPNPRKFRFFMGLLFVAFLFIVIMGNVMYAVYADADGKSVKKIIQESTKPRADTLVMEVKKHVGNFFPALMFIPFMMSLYYRDELFVEKERKVILVILVGAILFLTVGIFGAGALIAKIASL